MKTSKASERVLTGLSVILAGLFAVGVAGAVSSSNPPSPRGHVRATDIRLAAENGSLDVPGNAPEGPKTREEHEAMRREYEAMKNELQEMPRPQLMAIIAGPEPTQKLALRRQLATETLVSTGLSMSEMETLTGIALRGDDMLMDALARPRYEIELMHEEKEKQDRFMDLLESHLNTGGSSASTTAVRALWRLLDMGVRHESLKRQYGDQVGLPYNNGRAIGIMLKCLECPEPRIRLEAVKGLCSVGANDHEQVGSVIAALQRHRERERQSHDYDGDASRLSRVLRDIDSAVENLKREVPPTPKSEEASAAAKGTGNSAQ